MCASLYAKRDNENISSAMKIVLVSTYEMGRQPFGLASPAAWLETAAHQVRCLDLSVCELNEDSIRWAELVAIYLPMHTATRLAIPRIETVRRVNPEAYLCCFGLYAPLNESYLRQLGVSTVIGGEFEPALVRLADALGRGDAPVSEPVVALDRVQFQVPDRTGLPPLASYAKLRVNGSTRLAGYTEASRGCKHLCRHCPVVPVYQGKFRVVQPEIVREDIRRQVAAGATHITFGDPDFWNGPAHATRIVEGMARGFPGLSYDATIKIEHLRRHRELLPVLQRTGCLFVTSAVESLDDEVLLKLEKGHTQQDFREVVEDFRRIGLLLAPTFIAFTPWTTLVSHRSFLAALAGLDLIENVSPVQLGLRLLIPAGSRLLELADVQAVVQGFDAPALLHRWAHPDPEVDALASATLKVAGGQGSRRELFRKVWDLAHGAPMKDFLDLLPRAAIPYMDEPWYC
jgi:radical SAM superfamily enzyme YgiQ (UPF0313 family)